MPDPHRIERELLELLSKPEYTALLARHQEFANSSRIVLDRMQRAGLGNSPVYQHRSRSENLGSETAAQIARQTAEFLFRNHPLRDPVEVVEFRGRMEFYRVHDGGESIGSAGTLGRSWIERTVFKDLWDATATSSNSAASSRFPLTPGAKLGVSTDGKSDRRSAFLKLVRTSNFIHPDWNAMTAVVCMTVPAGVPVVAVRGKGDWKAMKNAQLQTSADLYKLGMKADEATMQCVIPLINEMWITTVPLSLKSWPLST